MHKLRFVIFGLIASLGWAFLSVYLITVMGYRDCYASSQDCTSALYQAFIACIWAPLWEETLYRYVPITIAKHFNGNRGKLVTAAVLGSSAIFGWGHGDCQEGVFIQGILGVILAFVYLKTNDIKYSMLTHALYNGTLVIMSMVIGGETLARFMHLLM